jgi:transcriptional antiterminator RfaH
MLKLEENPPAQWPEDCDFAGFTGRWWVAHTKPRQEKSLAWDIFRSDGNYYLPMYQVMRSRHGRSWKTMLVLFPGYLFLCCDEDARIRTLQTNRVAQLIEVIDQNRLISELSAVKRLIATKLEIDPYPGLAQGTLCRVKSGPLAGLEGKVDRKKSASRLIVEVCTLGQSVAVEIDASLLEAIE